MNNDNEMIWPIVAIVGLYIFYKISLTNAAVTSQQIASQTATANDPWLTVPGAIGSGLTGIGSLLNGFDNLFSSNSTTNSGY